MGRAIRENDAAGSTEDETRMQIDEDDEMPPLEGDEERITIPVSKEFIERADTFSELSLICLYW